MTEYVVWCETHGNYLKFVSSTGTTWCDDQAEAKRHSTKPAAAKAAKEATWLDHRPIVWAVAVAEAEGETCQATPPGYPTWKCKLPTGHAGRHERGLAKW